MLFAFGLLQFICEFVSLFFYFAQSRCHGDLSFDLTGIQSGLEPLDLGILDSSSLLQFVRTLGLSELDGIALVLLGQLKPFMQLLVEILVTNLLEDVRVTGLINLECFPAVRANDFMHDFFLLSWRPPKD